MAGSFTIDLSRFASKARGDMRTVIRKITMEAFKRVILRTPVDTGRARANWSVSEGGMNTRFEISAVDKSGSATIGTATQTVNGWECTGSIFLSNNLAYIVPLEYGHSKQAPGGMVRLTVAEMQSWARDAGNVKAGYRDLRDATRK
jgi:hypothetical protein